MAILPFSRSKRAPPDEIGQVESALPQALLPVPPDYASQSSSSEVYRLRLAGRPFAVSLFWQPDHCPPGKARATAQKFVRDQRAQSALAKRFPSISSAEPAAAAAPDADSAPSPSVVAVPDDLLCVRPSTPMEVPGEPRPTPSEQAGLAQTAKGHQVGDYSLAALLAARARYANTTFFLTIEDTSRQKATTAWYFLVVQDGLIRPSTDRCFTNSQDAHAHLHRWLLTLAKSQPRRADSFSLVVSPSVHLPRYDPDHHHLADLLVGPYPPALSSVFFTLSPAARRRLVYGTAAVSLAAAVAGGGFIAYDAFFGSVRPARDVAALRDAAEVQVARITFDPVLRAPWEHRSAVRPSEFVRSSLAITRSVPVSAPSPTGLGAFALRDVQVTDDYARLVYATLLPVVASSASASEPGSVLWPSQFEREVALEPLARDPFAYAPIDLQPVSDSIDDPLNLESAVRVRLVSRINALLPSLASAGVTDTHPADIVYGTSEGSGHLAWALQRFELVLPLPAEASSALLALLDSVEGLQVTSVEAVELSESTASRGAWRLHGYLGGVLDLLSETRDLERRAADQERELGPAPPPAPTS